MTTYGGNRSPGSAFERFEQDTRRSSVPRRNRWRRRSAMISRWEAAAVEKAGSFEGQAVRDALHELQDVPGATGLITYKDSPIGKGIPKKDYAVVTFDTANRKFVVELWDFPRNSRR